MRRFYVVLILIIISGFTFASVVYTGFGDDVIDIQKPQIGKPAIALITGNNSESYFGVIPYNAAGERGYNLVNTADKYDGLVPLDFGDKFETDMLEISASGPWEITLMALSELPSSANITNGVTFADDSEWVLRIVGSTSKTATIKGNAEGGFFCIFPYSDTKRLRSMVSTLDPYEGKVIIPSGTKYLHVIAEYGSKWAITLN